MTLTKTLARDWALHGGAPAFRLPLPAGQRAFPEWSRYEAAMRDIFERQYYTNHGPLARRLEQRLAQTLSARHAVCVTNGTIAMVMAAEALGRKGRVLVPATAASATLQALIWAGHTPVPCDVDPTTGQVVSTMLAARLDADVVGAVIVDPWGGCCDATPLRDWAAQHGLPLLFESTQAFGGDVDGRPLRCDGLTRVLSFHADEVFNTADGGCIVTDDDELAARLRNIRSSYGAGDPVEVVKTSNGRMSEAQAAIGLLNLDDLPMRLARNRVRAGLYRERLAGVPGLRCIEPAGVSASNHQFVAYEIDAVGFGMPAARLQSLLSAENVGVRRVPGPRAHRALLATPPLEALPVSERLEERVLLLPQHVALRDDDVVGVCELIRAASAAAPVLCAAETI